MYPVLEPFNSHSHCHQSLSRQDPKLWILLLTWLFHSSLCGCFNWHLLSLLKHACSGATFYFVLIKMEKLCHLCGYIKGCRNCCACFLLSCLSPVFSVSSELTFITETPAAGCKVSFEEAHVPFSGSVARRPLLQAVLEEAGI